MSKQASSYMCFCFFYSTWNKLVSLLFSQMKLGQLLDFYFYLCLSEYTSHFSVGKGKQMGVDNKGEMTVLEVFDMQQSNCSQSSDGRCIAEKQLHIKYMFSL